MLIPREILSVKIKEIKKVSKVPINLQDKDLAICLLFKFILCYSFLNLLTISIEFFASLNP